MPGDHNPMKPQPLDMFQDRTDDMPLFSGTAQKVTVAEYKPQEQARPIAMFLAACNICYGTKQIKNKKGRLIPCMYCK